MTRRRILMVGCSLAVVLSTIAWPVQAQAAVTGVWSPTGSLQSTIGGEIRLVSLLDGRVLAVGGATASHLYSTTSQLYDPATGQWSLTGSYSEAKGQVSLVVLNNGKVLMAGGEPLGGGTFTTAELFDPATGTWSPTGSMNQPRSATLMVKLLDGRVLVAGGATHPGTTATTEIYDPATGQWTQVGNMQVPVEAGSAVVLNDGRVLKVGAAGAFSSPTNSAVAELFDPATNQWTQTGSLQLARYTAQLIRVPDGRVLMVAGNQWGPPAYTESEIYDPATGQWTVTGSTHYPRTSRLALMPDGRVLAAGGDDAGVTGAVLSSEIYDPPTGTWSVDASLNAGHNPADLVALPNGDFLIAGGFGQSGPTPTAERYHGQGQSTATFNASADTNVRSGQTDRNYGGSHLMRVRSDGNNRALVRFDQSAIASQVGTGAVVSARLRLTITDNANNWGASGRTVDAHRMLVSWTEGNGTEASRGSGPGATWNCATDALIENQAKNCADVAAWQMGQPNNPAVHPWTPAPTDSRAISNGQTGLVEYDVTQDVIAFLNGTANYGWLIKKTNESQAGQVSFGARESATAPELVVTYQSSTSTWQDVAPLPGAQGTLTATTGLDGLIYAVEPRWGGNEFRAYNPQTDTWTTLAPMPTSRFSLSLQSGADGRVYAIGGTDGLVTDYTIVEAYDPGTNTWTCSVGDVSPGCAANTIAPMPTARSSIHGASARGSDGRIFVVGGNATGVYTAAVEAYNPGSNTWSSLAPLAVARDGRAVAGTDGRIYYMGGAACLQAVCQTVTTVEIYEPSTDTWSMGAPMPGARAQFAIARGTDNRIYTIGGLRDVPTLEVLASVDVYDPQLNSWTSGPTLPFPRSYLAGASDANGQIYAIGGTLCVCNTFETTVQALDTDGNP